MSLRLQYASDLHLEFSENRAFLMDNPLLPEGAVLVLAGDVVPFSVMGSQMDFFSYLSDHFEHTYWLPGNHEYYGSDLAGKTGAFVEKIRNNVFLVNNTSVIHDKVKLIFSTLWTRISDVNRWLVERGMNDFRLIRHNGQFFSADECNRLFKENITFILRESTAAADEKMAVFTHHCPTFLNYPERYRGDVLNEAFAVELHDLIEQSNIRFWVYGHHHSNTPSFAIGSTLMVTNQLGYVHRNEHRLFSTNKYVDI